MLTHSLSVPSSFVVIESCDYFVVIPSIDGYTKEMTASYEIRMKVFSSMQHECVLCMLINAKKVEQKKENKKNRTRKFKMESPFPYKFWIELDVHGSNSMWRPPFSLGERNCSSLKYIVGASLFKEKTRPFSQHLSVLSIESMNSYRRHLFHRWNSIFGWMDDGCCDAHRISRMLFFILSFFRSVSCYFSRCQYLDNGTFQMLNHCKLDGYMSVCVWTTGCLQLKQRWDFFHSF